jgi:hypothetical protein
MCVHLSCFSVLFPSRFAWSVTGFCICWVITWIQRIKWNNYYCYYIRCYYFICCEKQTERIIHYILSLFRGVTIDVVWIGYRIYWPPIYTIRN